MNVVFVLICFFGPTYGRIYDRSARATTENGVLEGTTYTLPNDRVVYAFYGIPFAAPPIGSNRFEVNVYFVIYSYLINYKIST